MSQPGGQIFISTHLALVTWVVYISRTQWPEVIPISPTQSVIHTHFSSGPCHSNTCFTSKYGVALVSRIDRIAGLLSKETYRSRYSSKETYHFINPTDSSHPIRCTNLIHALSSKHYSNKSSECHELKESCSASCTLHKHAARTEYTLYLQNSTRKPLRKSSECLELNELYAYTFRATRGTWASLTDASFIMQTSIIFWRMIAYDRFHWDCYTPKSA